MLIVIRGAGDLASGVAVRLRHAGFKLVMTDVQKPTAIRREVSFCRAIETGEAIVEDVTARLCHSPDEAKQVAEQGIVAVLVDPECGCLAALRPAALVDAILAKQNLGTRITDASAVVALGPGFTAGTDCHAVVETMRGHDLGRVYYEGSAMANTGVPGMLGGYAAERILRAPADGVFEPISQIGQVVNRGDVVAMVAGRPMQAAVGGVIRGLLPEGTSVRQGMKSGDVDPRGVVESCYTVSDKARAIGGGVLEALLHLTGAIEHG